MAQIQPDALNAVNVRIPSWMNSRRVPAKKDIVGSAQKHIDESLWFDGADLALIERLASERMAALLIKRIKAKKLSGGEQIDGGLAFVTTDVRDSNNSRQREVNEFCLLVLVKNDVIFGESFYE